MPDWRHEARTLLAAGYGQRESARKLGVPEDRLRKWASREGITSTMKATLAKMSPVVSPREPQPGKMSPAVTTAAEIIQGDAERLGPNARHIAARIGHKALSQVERGMDVDPEAGLVQLDSALTAGKLMQTANVPGWERQQQASTGINLLVAGNAQVLVQGPVAPD